MGVQTGILIPRPYSKVSQENPQVDRLTDEQAFRLYSCFSGIIGTTIPEIQRTILCSAVAIGLYRASKVWVNDEEPGVVAETLVLSELNLPYVFIPAKDLYKYLARGAMLSESYTTVGSLMLDHEKEVWSMLAEVSHSAVMKVKTEFVRALYQAIGSRRHLFLKLLAPFTQAEQSELKLGFKFRDWCILNHNDSRLWVCDILRVGAFTNEVEESREILMKYLDASCVKAILVDDEWHLKLIP